MRVGLHPVLREPKGFEPGEGEESEREGKGRRDGKERAEERGRKEGVEKRGGKTFERRPPCDRQEIRNVRKEQTT